MPEHFARPEFLLGSFAALFLLAATPGDPPGTPLAYDPADLRPAQAAPDPFSDPHAALRADPALSPFAAEDAILAYLANPAQNAPTGPDAEIITLSNLAEACVHRVAKAGDDDPAWKLAGACAGRVTTIALDRFMAGDSESKLPADTLVLSHLVIVLAAADHAERSTAWDNANHELLVRAADRLESRLIADTEAIPPSFTTDSRRWPADSAASIYALWLAEQVAPADHAESRWKEPARRFIAWSAQRGLAGDWGLPISELTGADSAAAIPRGSAMSWIIRYQAAWDAPSARRMYERYRALFYVRSPAAGFREFPPAVDRPADADSGTIIGGIGSEATALAVGAARAVGDTETFAALRAAQWAAPPTSAQSGSTVLPIANGPILKLTAVAPDAPAPPAKSQSGSSTSRATAAPPADTVLARSIAVNHALLTPWFKDGK